MTLKTEFDSFKLQHPYEYDRLFHTNCEYEHSLCTQNTCPIASGCSNIKSDYLSCYPSLPRSQGLMLLRYPYSGDTSPHPEQTVSTVSFQNAIIKMCDWCFLSREVSVVREEVEKDAHWWQQSPLALNLHISLNQTEDPQASKGHLLNSLCSRQNSHASLCSQMLERYQASLLLPRLSTCHERTPRDISSVSHYEFPVLPMQPFLMDIFQACLNVPNFNPAMATKIIWLTWVFYLSD